MTSAADSGYVTISQINFTGGFPTHADLAPSIVFLVVVSSSPTPSGSCQYALTCPLLVFRIARKEDRTTLLIRPGIFLACRISSLVIRAVMAKTTYGIGLLSEW